MYHILKITKKIFSILPHLPRSNFASRPVARDGVTYNVENIRAIPFTMALAQMREFTSAYYGSGYALEKGTGKTPPTTTPNLPPTKNFFLI